VWALSGALVAFVLAVFGSCLAHELLWDDEPVILQNQFLKSVRFLPQLLTKNMIAGAGFDGPFYRPLQLLTHFVDVQVFGQQAWGHHLTNLVWHVIASVVAFRVLLRVLPLWPAWMAAAAFSLHPLHAFAVAYVSGRGDTLALLFGGLGLLAFARSRAWCAVAAVLAMLSKEHLMMFPVLLWLYDRAGPSPAPFSRHAPLWVLPAASLCWRGLVVHAPLPEHTAWASDVMATTWSFRLATYLTTLPEGLRLWLWPADLHHHRSWPIATSWTAPHVLWSGLLVGGLVAFGLLRWRKNRLAATGVLWFLLATVPTSNLFVLINAVFADHWFIFPGLGLAFVFGGLLQAGLSSPRPVRPLILAISAGLLAAEALSTVAFIQTWRNPIRLFSQIRSHEPDLPKVSVNLANAYLAGGRFTDAIELYRTALGHPSTTPAMQARIHHNLGRAYLILNREPEAARELRQALEREPDFHPALVLLGGIALRHNQLAEAAALFERAIRRYPYGEAAYLGLAQVYLGRRHVAAARQMLEAGLKVLPHDEALQRSLAYVQHLPASVPQEAIRPERR